MLDVLGESYVYKFALLINLCSRSTTQILAIWLHLGKIWKTVEFSPKDPNPTSSFSGEQAQESLAAAMSFSGIITSWADC